MYGLIGPHVNRLADAAHLRAWQPPVALVLDPGPEWAGLARELPATRFVWRIYHPDQPDFNEGGLDAAGAARSWVARDLPAMLGLGGAGGWWQGVNEPAIGSPEAMARYAAFEMERVRVLERYGLRAALGAFAVGNPPRLDWWGEFEPALWAARPSGVLLLHEYAWPSLRGGPGSAAAWTSLRHRMVYEGCAEHGWAGLPGPCKLPLIIGECGADIGVVQPGTLGGWRDVMTAEECLADLDWYSRELELDNYVLGGCVFCDMAESWQWTGYDIWPNVARTLADQARPIYRRLPLMVDPGRGLDVSAWQGLIQWEEVRRAGYSFVLARSSAGASADRRWRGNWAGATSIGVQPYHFMTADVPVLLQAAAMLGAAGRDWPAMWIDVEWEKRTGAGPTEAQVREMVARIEDTGGKAGIYTSRYQWQRLGHTGWAGRLPLWVADWNPAYAGKPRLPAGWTTWRYQQTTSAGTVPGIAGRVDLDIANMGGGQ